MVLLINRRRLLFMITALVLTLLAATGYSLGKSLDKPVQDENPGYRVYVHGVGTVQGAWGGRLGIAVIGVETKPDTNPEKELKVITLLVANQSREKIRFDPDIALVDHKGNTYALHGAAQPMVEIAPGTLSKGVVIIDVPRGIKDESWRLTVTGGPLPGPVTLPLQVVTVKIKKPE